jgi:predicted dehydrogenase
MSSLVPKRVLISGLGSIGRRYCRLIQSNWPSIQIAALRSGHGTASSEADSLVHSFSDLHHALAWNPEAAIISSPASSHLEQAHHFARQGIPLLIEKPVGTGFECTEDWDLLKALADTSPIYVGYVLRHDPCVDFIREQLSGGKLGRLMTADFYCGSWLPGWRPDLDYRRAVSARRNLGGGALLELSHELDLALWILGPLRPLGAMLHNSGVLDIDVEDVALLLALANEECAVSIRLDFCTKPSRRIASFRSVDGEYEWDLLHGVVVRRFHGHESEVFASDFSADQRYCRQLELFWQFPAAGQSSLCSLQEALAVLDLISQVRILASTGDCDSR